MGEEVCVCGGQGKVTSKLWGGCSLGHEGSRTVYIHRKGNQSSNTINQMKRPESEREREDERGGERERRIDGESARFFECRSAPRDYFQLH
jgi:hypothetical protein